MIPITALGWERATLYLMKLLAILFLSALAWAQDAGKTTRAQLTPERAITAARHMRDRLNDPDSLRVVSFLYREHKSDEHYVCVVFRAKEQGSLVLERYANNATDDSPGGINPPDVIWDNIMCNGEAVYDATDVVKAALKADRENAKDE